MFIVFSGPSGCGKNTIINALQEKRDDFKVLRKSTGTTRAPRESDKENDTYVYLTHKEFEKGIEDGIFYEYENVHGNYYGTFKEKLEFAAQSDIFYVRDVDVNGNASLKKFFADKCKMLSIFIDVPDDILRTRLAKRGDASADIEKRISRGEFERSRKAEYDLAVDNIDLETTIQTISDFIDKSKSTK